MTVGERQAFFAQFEISLASGELTDFGAAIRSLRACTGFGQRRFARAVRLPLEMLRAIESNQFSADIITLNKILFAFGFQAGITRFKRQTHPDPELYLKTGQMASHRRAYP